MKNLHRYQSYRYFLDDIFKAEKASTPGVTLATFAKRFEMSASLFKMILTHKRNLTLGHIHSIARALRMTRIETEYFESLVHFEQSTDERSKAYYRGRLSTVRRESKVINLRTGEKKLLSNSVVPGFLIYLMDIKKINSNKSLDSLNRKDLGKIFSLTENQISEMIEIIRDVNFDFKDPKKSAHIIYEKISHRLGEKEYMIDEINECVRQLKVYFSGDSGIFRAYTLTLQKSDILSLRSDMTDLLESYMAKPTLDDENRTVQKLVIASYPLIEIPAQEESLAK